MQKNLKRQECWNEHFNLWTASNLSQSEYCRRNNLDQQLFSKWKIRILKQDENNKKNKFVKISGEIKNSLSFSCKIELFINDKYKINIQPDFDQNTLKRLLETIEG